ncbi:di-trans,poly-cis-decaprenylcistransferase [Candidatus Woesearchaeota archaeon]|nr:di-trans,poly-cis-decaprenylcistransferase [Candidatus Woesearchaeota archaeon]
MEQGKNPEHIAVILDGNRRYARKKGLNPWDGHRLGADKVKDILQWCRDLGIKELTLYTFSVDNFNRPEQEKNAIFAVFKKGIEGLNKNYKKLNEYGVQVNFIGRLNMFPEDIQKEMHEVMEKTKNNTKSRLNIAIAYSSKAEITDSLKKIIKKLKNNEIKEEDINEKMVNDNLYLSSAPDILIRPGGEKRLSDFLLWQSAYTELFFVDKLWPEFTQEDLVNVIEQFKKRERRFGR